MRATINRKLMLDSFSSVASVAPARSPKPILQNIKLIADPDEGSVLMATDLEVGIRHQVLGMVVETPGSAILPTQRFTQILRSTSDEELLLEASGDHLIVRGRRSEFKLPGEDPSGYPEVPGFDAASYHTVSAADLRKLIRRTMFATDAESTRYALSGVLVELTDSSISMVGTDGRRLARMTAGAEPENDAPPPTGSPVIPAKALKLIERNLDDDDPPVHIAISSGSNVLVRSENAVIYSRLVEGRFPRYQDVFPAETAVSIHFPEITELRQAVEQASIVTSEESRGVDFRFGVGSLTLSSQAADVGKSHVDMPIDYDGSPLEITFDPRYLTDALKALDDSAAITVELIDAKNAAVCRTEDGYAYVLMPLARDR